MAASRDITNLKLGMENRDIIGQAKGILMERFKIAPHEAFDLLVMASQSTHRKLREVADELAATGELAIPTPSSRRHGR
jgi:AmiR/NasT family two-component response regulator